MGAKMEGCTANGWWFVYAQPRGGIIFDFQKNRLRIDQTECLGYLLKRAKATGTEV